MTVHEQKAKADLWSFMNQNRDVGIAAIGAVFIGLAVSHSLGNLWPLIASQTLAVFARSRGGEAALLERHASDDTRHSDMVGHPAWIVFR